MNSQPRYCVRSAFPVLTLLAAGLSWLLVFAATPVFAETSPGEALSGFDAPVAPAPSESETGSALPSGEEVIAELTGEEIYRRVLANRHKSYFQKQILVSEDAGGASDSTELWTRWQDARDENGKIKRKTLSKTLAKYTAPRGVRGMGYLIVQKLDMPHDSFVYFPSMRKVRRVRLDEAIMGTDYSIEDIIPRELETADYRRSPDEDFEGVSCYVVELLPKKNSSSQYSRLQVFVEKEHYVNLRTRYWDLDQLETKEYRASASEIEELEGVWLTMRGTMRNLIENSSTRLTVVEMLPNAQIKKSAFSERALMSKGR